MLVVVDVLIIVVFVVIWLRYGIFLWIVVSVVGLSEFLDVVLRLFGKYVVGFWRRVLYEDFSDVVFVMVDVGVMVVFIVVVFGIYR